MLESPMTENMNNPAADDLIAVGKFGKTRGLRGEIYVTPYNSDPDRILGLESAFRISGNEKASFDIERSGVISNRPVFKIRGYDTPEAVGALTNTELFVPRNKLEELPEDSYFTFDLVGLAVETVAGVALGTIREVDDYPANDVYVIENDSGEIVLFPAVKRFVIKIDLENKLMVVDPPNGLLEINK